MYTDVHRHDKAGKVISYRIRVSRGYDLEGNKLKPYEMTFKPAPGMTRRQAEKEMLVPYNAAEKVVNKPKAARSHPVNYFQPEELERIRDALEQEPLKWQVITHLLLVTGCRRGEIMGLKWSAVDLQAGTLRIENNLLYSRKLGVYEDTTKTETSARVIRIPEETAQLLHRYREEWETLRQTYGASWNSYLQIPTGSGELHSQRAEFLFIREEAGKVGYPMNPDSPTGWLAAFSK